MTTIIDKKDIFYSAIILFLLFILMGVLYVIDTVEDGCNNKWEQMLNESGYGHLIWEEQPPTIDVPYERIDMNG